MCCRRQVLLRNTDHRRRIERTMAISMLVVSAMPTGDEAETGREDIGARAARSITDAKLRTVARGKATGRGAGETKTAKKDAGPKRTGGLRARIRGRVLPA